MNILGIDPGKDGAAVLIRDQSHVHAVLASELLCGQSWEAAHAEVTRWLRLVHATWPLDLVVLERVGGRPGEGATSARTMGVGWGLWLGAASILGVPVIIPTPQRWQREILADLAGDTKARSVAWCRAHLPELDLTPGRRRVPHDGLADAACLAVYGRRHG
jgi:crossover junction endodeoxyribonuclease RuvC